MKRFLSFLFTLTLAATVAAQIIPATGPVRGPASATDNAVARFDGTTGKIIQNSTVTIADTTGDIATGGNITAGTGGNTVTLSAGAVTATGDISSTHAQGSNRYMAVLTTGKANTVFGFNDSGSTFNAVPTGKSYFGNLNGYDVVFTDGVAALATLTNGAAGGSTFPGTGSHVFGTTNTVTLAAGTIKATAVAEYADNAAAVTAGLAVGTFYRTGDVLKVVH